MKIVEIFKSFQGEGKYIGERAIFVRLAGCNLNCRFCDTEKSADKNLTRKDIVNFIEENKEINRIVITGGEPLLQQEELLDLFESILHLNPKITIETNGTITPLSVLNNYVDHWSVSPKLATSGNDLDKRFNYDALESFLETDDFIFKFVVCDKMDVDEINKLVEQVRLKNVYLMPEGDGKQEQQEKMEPVINLAINNNYNFSPRLHILIWGNKRGV